MDCVWVRPFRPPQSRYWYITKHTHAPPQPHPTPTATTPWHLVVPPPSRKRPPACWLSNRKSDLLRVHTASVGQPCPEWRWSSVVGRCVRNSVVCLDLSPTVVVCVKREEGRGGLLHRSDPWEVSPTIGKDRRCRDIRGSRGVD